MPRLDRKMLPGCCAGRLGGPKRTMAANCDEALAAITITVLQDKDRGASLAPDAKAFDLGIPDSLARCQLRYRFRGYLQNCQISYQISETALSRCLSVSYCNT